MGGCVCVRALIVVWSRKGSVASEESFDPEAQGGARGTGGGRGGGKSVSSEHSFDAEAVSPGTQLLALLDSLTCIASTKVYKE